MLPHRLRLNRKSDTAPTQLTIASATASGSTSYFVTEGGAGMGMRFVCPLARGAIATGRWLYCAPPALKSSAEDGETAAARERVHPALDGPLDLLVLAVDVAL